MLSLDLVARDVGRSSRMDSGLRVFRWMLRWAMREEARRHRSEASSHILVGQLS